MGTRPTTGLTVVLLSDSGWLLLYPLDTSICSQAINWCVGTLASHKLSLLGMSIWASLVVFVGFCLADKLTSVDLTEAKRLRPFTSKTARQLGWQVPVCLTLFGILHPFTSIYYATLARCFAFLEGIVLVGAVAMVFVGKAFGTRIQDPDKPHDFQSPYIRQEALETSVAMYVFACLAAWPVSFYRIGIPCALKNSLEETGDDLVFYMYKTLFGLLAADCWNYWKHRLLHTRFCFAFHRPHHMFRDPTPFAGFAVHPVEALLTFGPVVFACVPQVALCIPLHAPLIFGLFVLNLYLHCGYSIWILEKTLPLLFINSSTFHNTHHEKTRTHFGEILYLWDWILETGTHQFGWHSKAKLLGPTVKVP